MLPDGDDVAKSYRVWGTPGVIIVNDDLEIVFNLYELPRQEPLKDEDEAGHRKKAAYRGPYWAAEIRKSIDSLLEKSLD